MASLDGLGMGHSITIIFQFFTLKKPYMIFISQLEYSAQIWSLFGSILTL